MLNSRKSVVLLTGFLVFTIGLIAWVLSIRFSTENQYFDIGGVYGPTPDCEVYGHKGEEGTVSLLEHIRYGKTMCSFEELYGGEIKKVSGYFIFDNPERCVFYPDMHLDDIVEKRRRGELVEPLSFKFKKLGKDQIEISINDGPMQIMTRCTRHED